MSGTFLSTDYYAKRKDYAELDRVAYVDGDWGNSTEEKSWWDRVRRERKSFEETRVDAKDSDQEGLRGKRLLKQCVRVYLRIKYSIYHK